MRGFILAAVLAALLPSAASGPFTLEECIRMALGSDRSLRQREAALSESRTERALSILDWIPEISVGAGNDFNWGRSVDMQELLIVDNRMTLTTSFTANASVSLTKLALKPLRGEGLRLDEEDASLALELARRQLAADVTGCFLQVLLCRQACGICEGNTAEMEAALAEARARVEAGEMAPGELSGMEAQLCRERSAAVEAANRLKLAGLTLCDYLDLPPEEELQLLPPTEDSLPRIDWKRVLDYSCGDDPGISAARNGVERGKNSIKLAWAAFLPQITLSGGCGTYYGNTGNGSFGRQLSNNINPYASVTLSIPLTGGSANARALSQAKTELRSRILEMEKVRIKSASDLRSELAEADNLYASHAAAKGSLEAATRAEADAALRFRAGEISGSEYLSARNARIKAQAELLQARYRYLLKLKILEYRYGIKSY